MSKRLDPSEYEPTDVFELGAYVSFLHDGVELQGRVVRIYNTREYYHVEVAGVRYMVHHTSDNMKRVMPLT